MSARPEIISALNAIEHGNAHYSLCGMKFVVAGVEHTIADDDEWEFVWDSLEALERDDFQVSLP
jgi:hypothetical protein